MVQTIAQSHLPTDTLMVTFTRPDTPFWDRLKPRWAATASVQTNLYTFQHIEFKLVQVNLHQLLPLLPRDDRQNT